MTTRLASVASCSCFTSRVTPTADSCFPSSPARLCTPSPTARCPRLASATGRQPRPGIASLSARASAGRRQESAEKALRTTVELDKLIDTLRGTDFQELPRVVAENIFSFDQNFWLRLATRADTCATPDDRRDLEELSQQVMMVVERLVRCTEEQMDSTSDKLADLLMAAAVVEASSGGEEIVWPPRDPSTMQRLRDEIKRRDGEGVLDDTFLASLTAQLRQATERGDRPGLVAMLQKVLQLYAAARFGTRSYSLKGDGETNEAEALLESLLQGEVESWDGALRAGLKLGGGKVSEDELFEVLELRSKRMLMRTESGSYEQRILGEYLAELETRAKAAVEAFSSA